MKNIDPRRPTRSLAAAGALALAASAPVLAYGNAQSEQNHLLSVGGGIASPSVTSALGENPAGLANNTTPKLLFQATAEDDRFDPIGYGGGLFLGNGSVGAGLGLHGIDGSLLLSWGLATEIPALDMAVGFTGTRALSGSDGSIGQGWTADAGVIFNPRGKSRIGLTVFRMFGGIDAVGAGWACDLSSWATFDVDAVHSVDAESTMAKPALALHLPGFQITSGYGVRVQGSFSGGWIREGLSLGVGVPLTRNLAIQGYYRQLAEYYAGLTVSL